MSEKPKTKDEEEDAHTTAEKIHHLMNIFFIVESLALALLNTSSTSEPIFFLALDKLNIH